MVFSAYIVWYLFLAGMGSGCYALAAGFSMYDAIRKTKLSEDVATCAQVGFLVAPALTALSALLLAFDLGSIEPMWRIVFNLRESIIADGALFVMVFTVVSVAVAACGIAMRSVPKWLLWSGWIVGGVLSVCVMTYTGLFFSSIVAVDFWNTLFIPALFVVSSFSTGLAAILCINAVSSRCSKPAMVRFWRLAAFLCIGELLLLTVFLVERNGFSEASRLSCMLAIQGNLRFVFWGGVVACGIVLPLLVHVLYHKITLPALILLASVGVLAGGLCLRCLIVGAAVYPLAAMEGFL